MVLSPHAFDFGSYPTSFHNEWLPIDTPPTPSTLQTMNTANKIQHRFSLILLFLLVIIPGSSTSAASDPEEKRGTAGSVLMSERYAEFNEPWAMTFLPGGNILVTEKSGTLLLISADGTSKLPVDGVPKIAYDGQGGLGDVILHPQVQKEPAQFRSAPPRPSQVS